MSSIETSTNTENDGGDGRTKATATATTSKIDRWCVITNGGCSPIALQLAERRNLKNAADAGASPPVSNLILSSVPRLPFFLKNYDEDEDTAATTSNTSAKKNDPSKVAKSYRTLSGIPGNLFWWYACRKEGAFIQTFSEKNLIADPKNLGEKWRSNCYETAILYNGRGKYSTFSFLAGTLQDGCRQSLEALKDTPVQIDVIKGADIRRNQAKSWFWQKQKKTNKNDKNKDEKEREGADQISTPTVKKTNNNNNNNKTYETFRDYVENNGNGGKEVVIEGRISLAHEDPDGYADAILQFLFGR